MVAQYGPVRVERPPGPRKSGGVPRKSALVHAVEGCFDDPNEWWRVAVYEKKSSAYSACRRMKGRDWDRPIVFVVRPADDNGSEDLALFVKVLEVPRG